MEKDYQKLKNFFSSNGNTRNENLVLIESIVKGCLVPRYTWYNWLSGRCKIPGLAKLKIEEIAGRKIF